MIQSWSLVGIYLFQGWIKAWGAEGGMTMQHATLHSSDQSTSHQRWARLVLSMGAWCTPVCHSRSHSADTRPGPTPLLWSGWHSPSLLHCDLVTCSPAHRPSRLHDVTDVTNVTFMVSPCWPDQCQCVTACKALYTCTAHMSVLSEFHPLSSGPHLDRDRSGVLATASVHQTQATIICIVYCVHSTGLEKIEEDKSIC